MLPVTSTCEPARTGIRITESADAEPATQRMVLG
jgi:hypothetical protein